MSDRMIEVIVRETSNVGSVRDVLTVDLARATLAPRQAAALLRSLANDLAPEPKPAPNFRGGGRDA